MTTKTELQDILRFFTQDAKIPLQIALPKVKDLQKANLVRYGGYFANQSNVIVQLNYGD